MLEENRCGWHETNEDVLTPGGQISGILFRWISLWKTHDSKFRVLNDNNTYNPATVKMESNANTKKNINRKRQQQTKKTHHSEHMKADVDTNLSLIPISSHGPIYQNKIGRRRSMNRTNSPNAHKHEPSRAFTLIRDPKTYQ